ncbi:hypothetical protein B1R32_109108 [Abditibacterium utsteinense]|uniref:DUF4350 domain-containing protein n=1 Tax=Abditibacterium utsteinense TaxID=1960156 RepID=A0A2S8SSL9_9BACT|nr:DUF4350 domain-containing protein [Abditibacterium utsteinense]PQV63768.1 hypothetical protein B1R32_109108 [Abditibacterium utsteinense]
MKRRKLNPTRLFAGFFFFALCLLGVLTNSGHQSEELPRAQWGNKTPLGGQGLRLTLQKLGYQTKLQTASLQKMPADAKVWLLLDPQTRFSKAEAKTLLDWVRKGGVLLFCVRPQSYFLGASGFGGESQSEGVETLRNTLGIARSEGQQPKAGEFLPALVPLSLDTISNYRVGIKKASGSARNFTVSKPHLEVCGAPGGTIARLDSGKGRVLVFPDALLFTNYALSKADNANLVLNFVRVHVPSGAVYFDERSDGKSARSTAPPTLLSYLARPPASYAMLQLLVAALLFWAFAGRRLGTPVPLSPNNAVTRASQFAGAMGALFSKVNRPGAAALIIGARFRRRLAQRIGLSPSESDQVLARRAQEVSGIPASVTDRLLLQSRAPAQNMGEALRDAQEMERVLQKMEGKG